MDRPLSNPQTKKLFYFEPLDIFPYSVAILMFAAEVYIIHQFVVLTPMMQDLH